MLVIPKTKGRQYFPLDIVEKNSEILINKCEVKIENNKLYIDGREINSFILTEDNLAIIKAQHFTSREIAAKIRTYRRFSPSMTDNYVYFIEDGFHSISKEEIKHISGAQSAEVRFEVKFSTPLKAVWVKIEKNHPVKFAIEEGLSSDQIIEIILEKIS